MLMRAFQLPLSSESIQFLFIKLFIQAVRTMSNVGHNAWSFDISSWDIAWTLMISYFSNRSLNQWTRLIFSGFKYNNNSWLFNIIENFWSNLERKCYQKLTAILRTQVFNFLNLSLILRDTDYAKFDFFHFFYI